MKREQGYPWIRDVRAALSPGDLVEPPDWLRKRARRLFETRAPARVASLIGRVRASLVFDSRRRGFAAAGVRSSAVVEGPWQLLYRGGDVDVDLFVRPNQDGHTLNVHGQALPIAGGTVGAGVVEATPADAPRRSSDRGRSLPSARSELEPSGEFALSNLERGRYDVLLRFGSHEVELSDIEL